MKTQKVMAARLLGDPVLAARAEPVKRVDAELVKLAEEMLKSMFAFEGIGLAAPQVGVGLRLITLAVGMPEEVSERPLTPGEALLLPRMPLALVNPEIIDVGGRMVEAEEGCLSLPEIYATVSRPSQIELQASTLAGEPIRAQCGGWLARVLQHEIDHLDGTLFIDRVSPGNYRLIKPKVDRLRAKAKAKGFLRRLLGHESKKDELL